MRTLLVPAALAAFIATAPFAFAAQHATGTVKAFDAKAMTLTLNDNAVYMLPQGFKDPGLKPGVKVTVNWDQKGAQKQAADVTITK